MQMSAEKVLQMSAEKVMQMSGEKAFQKEGTPSAEVLQRGRSISLCSHPGLHQLQWTSPALMTENQRAR